MSPPRVPLLVPGISCGWLEAGGAGRSGLLVDGRDVYKAIYDACSRARRTILIAGWQFDNNIALLRGRDASSAAHPVRFLDFLRDLSARNPQLEIYLLAWDASPVFAFERVPLQEFLLRRRAGPRIHFTKDACHPAGASHHQKFVVVDRAVAVLGGMDICNSRWDRRAHLAADPLRRNRWRHYRPYHEVSAYVTGEAVDVLRDWFRERWSLATASDLSLPDAPRGPIAIEPTLEIQAPLLGLARTRPGMDVPRESAIGELHALHLRAIGAAERSIYVESQYFSSHEIEAALERRMTRSGPSLEIVIVLPHASTGLKERLAMGVHQAHILRNLGEVASRYGHRLGVYYSAARSGDRDVPVFVHSKVLAVDDRFLLVSSANLSSRSMGFDTELGIAWEAPDATPSLRAARVDLLAEQCGLGAAEAVELLAPVPGLVSRLDALATAGTHRLRQHARNADEAPGRLLSRLLPDPSPLDPRDPHAYRRLLRAWLRRS